MNFIHFLESQSIEQSYDYGCSMLFFSTKPFQKIYKNIDENDLYNEENLGIENEPHVTLLYGIHDGGHETHNRLSDSEIELLIQLSYPELDDYDNPLPLKLQNISYFDKEKYDVLKFDVSGDYIFDINKNLRDHFEYTTDFPKYHPHCTIAYLKKGKAKKYIKLFKKQEFEILPQKIVYSRPGKEKQTVSRDI